MNEKKGVKHALCTLFDHNYLDKGLVLYDSLKKYSSDFRLYVLAMSDKCYDVLVNLQLENLVPIRLREFEDDELLKVKKIRSVGEYCWTCSSSLIRYVLSTYAPEYCTYIDADMEFYADPSVAIVEMEEKKASVLVVGHRFYRYKRNYMINRVGRFCVEFNCFKNDDNSRRLLNIWRNQCLINCSAAADGRHWGDQKYLDNWLEDYDFVIETEHLGMGIGPWNIANYRFSHEENGNVFFKTSGNLCKVIFYHYENIKYMSRTQIQINAFGVWGVEDRLVYLLYENYLKRIEEKKKMLSSVYGIDVVLKSHPGYKTIEFSLVGWIKKVFCTLLRPRKMITMTILYVMETLPRKLFSKKNMIVLQ